MDGIEATRFIREQERERGGHMPIIALTARALREEREQSSSTKPLEFEALSSKMKRFLTLV